MRAKRILLVLIVLLMTACFPSNVFDLDESFDLAYGEIKRNLKENLRVRFDEIVRDDRCPFESQPDCIAPGNALVQLTVWKGLHKKSVVLNTADAPQATILFGYKIDLMQLEPLPSIQTPPIDDLDFRVTLMVSAAGNECFNNDDCAAVDGGGQRYCQKSDGYCKSIGQCSERPINFIMTVDPVCGCDDQTYPSVDAAAAAGVNVAHMGTCEPGKCSRNDECGIAEYCFFDAGSDQIGQCQSRPQACIDVFEPVCGRTGAEYANACEAALHGDSVAYTGTCLQQD